MTWSGSIALSDALVPKHIRGQIMGGRGGKVGFVMCPEHQRGGLING